MSDNSIFITYKHSGKMEGIVSINTSTEDNPFCLIMKEMPNAVCKYCYANRYERLRPTVSNRYKINGQILSESIIPYEDIPIINAKYCRLHSFGELINDIHLFNFVNIVNKNPNTIFTLWTKHIDIVKPILVNRPSNLLLIYSNPIIDTVMSVPNGFDGVFNVIKYIADIKDNCKKKCIECMKCYNGNRIGVIVEKVK